MLLEAESPVEDAAVLSSKAWPAAGPLLSQMTSSPSASGENKGADTLVVDDKVDGDWEGAPEDKPKCPNLPGSVNRSGGGGAASPKTLGSLPVVVEPLCCSIPFSFF